MCTTYVVGKRAAACVDEHGVLYYLLSEQSYESNVFPRTPTWCTRFFGRYEECIARMIDSSSAIEGGTLGGSAKTSTAYIKQWREQLAAPVRLDKTILSVRFDCGFYSLPESALAAVTTIAAKHGQTLPADGVLKVDMDYPGALRFLAALLSSGIEGMSSWRLFRNADIRTLPEPGLGTPVPKSVAAKLEDVVVYQMKAERGGDHAHFVSINGNIRSTGWAYSTMGSFISNEAVAAEQAAPGSAEPMIHAFRKLVAAAIDLPGTSRIAIAKPQSEEDSYQLERIKKFCAALGRPLEDRVEITYQDVINANVTEDLRRLSDEFVSFQFDAPPAATQPQSQQQLLIA